jgi:uncharacterized protein (TIGR02246 family)
MNMAVDAVAERRREWIAAVNAGSLEGYADLVAEDVVWLPPSGAALTSRQAFREWLEPFFRHYDYEFSVEPLEVRAFHGWCAEVGRFRSVLASGSSESQEHKGQYFVLWRLDADGSWRIERYVDGIGKVIPGLVR